MSNSNIASTNEADNADIRGLASMVSTALRNKKNVSLG